ncbi:MAG: M15 family metallopeptidase [Flavobacteriales bacterium]|nr:M15 family metallopeptidase [Flavobacteriales bacterium]
MCCSNDFINLFKKSSFTIKKNSDEKEAIQLLQNSLFHLGFGKILNWEKYGADGDYGNLTTKAVLSFCRQNNIDSNGEVIDKSIANIMVKRLDVLDELQLLQEIINNNQCEEIFYKNSPKKEQIQALQTLLNEAGFGKELNWKKYKNDGDYGNCTTNAVIAFSIKNNINSDGAVFNQELAQLLIKQLSLFYGEDWFLHPVSEIIESNKNPLVEFSGSHFTGKTVIADKDFVPYLKRINNYAKKHKVKIHVTSSFRKTSIVPGAIVSPAKMSNHMIGHAIDMNLQYGENFSKWCNSSCLAKTNLAEPVANFIQEIRNDQHLRWGGDFKKRDTVHIDDHYNKDIEKWKLKYNQIQQSL